MVEQQSATRFAPPLRGPSRSSSSPQSYFHSSSCPLILCNDWSVAGLNLSALTLVGVDGRVPRLSAPVGVVGGLPQSTVNLAHASSKFHLLFPDFWWAAGRPVPYKVGALAIFLLFVSSAVVLARAVTTPFLATP